MKSIILGAIMLLTTITANDLKNEQSPYLLQHKDNPVSWMAWSKDTLSEALKQDKLIFLSVGYSTCHWCHVMEEESFEDTEVAEVLNKDYISIKVDREEMPQLDSFYQSVYQTMNRRGGGWPLTIIMTPDKKAFWSGTYIPKKNLIGLLSEISEIYKNDRKKITDSANELHEIANRANTQDIQVIDSDLQKTIDTFTSAVTDGFDAKHGGHGGAPKFPRATMLEAMLDLYSINGDTSLLQKVNFTLKAMAEGGIYDQIESGFYRYSVDKQWLIPHFEKMLYTQAELLRVYTKAYAITKDKKYKTVIDDLVAFIDKRFAKDDLLYSASDADSLTEKGHKEEGYYFVFKYEDTYTYLKNKGYSLEDIRAILDYFHITKKGNFEHGQTNPHIAKNSPIKNLEKVKRDLEDLRAKKSYPFVDNKILTSWNAMYISSLFDTAKIDSKYGDRAITLLNTLIENMYVSSTLYHQKLIGKKLKVKGLFEDYAFLIDALTEAYQFSYDKRYMVLASILANDGVNKFYRDEQWYLSDDEFQTTSSPYDSAYASPQSVMTKALFKLSTLTDDTKLYALAKKSISQNSGMMQQYPSSIASAFNTFVGYKTEYKVLKSTQENLLKNRDTINKLGNPYLLTKAIDIEDGKYLACTIDRCFATESDLNVVLAKVEENSKK